jgi:hypothetical protein
MVPSAMILVLFCLAAMLCSTALMRRAQEQMALARISRQRAQRSTGTQSESRRIHGS